jgi:hypothetical protein
LIQQPKLLPCSEPIMGGNGGKCPSFSPYPLFLPFSPTAEVYNDASNSPLRGILRYGRIISRKRVPPTAL